MANHLAYPCAQAHTGPCENVLTDAFAMICMYGPDGPDTPARFVDPGRTGFATGPLSVERLPGVYLLGDYFVGAASDIGAALRDHLRQVAAAPDVPAARGYLNFISRKHSAPAVTVLSVNVHDLDFCTARLRDLDFPLVNRPQAVRRLPACIQQEDFGRQQCLRDTLRKVNRIQSDFEED